MAIVSASELREYMSSIGLDIDQAAAVDDILAGLQRELERYCQRPLEQRERTEVIVPDDLGRLWPKATPIVSVSTPVGLYAGGDNSIAGYSPAVLFGSAAYAPVTVTYVGGVVDPEIIVDPEEFGVDEAADVKIAILRAAAREATVRHDDTLGVTDLEVRQVQPVDRRDPGFTDDELKKFDRLRRRTVV